jgi:outer membrane protein assembly factor BamE (lipoprotein component of BamABCDE complex)
MKLKTAIGILVCSLILYFSLGGFSDFNRRPFDREVWFSSARTGFDDCIRGAMAGDVQNRIIKKGMSKQDVLNKLGPPDSYHSDSIEYILGMCDPIDPYGLNIFIGADGKVTNTEIVQH